MAVMEVCSGDMSRRKVMDEVYIALLDILKEAHQVMGEIPFQVLEEESGSGGNVNLGGEGVTAAEKAIVKVPRYMNQDAGYPFSFCSGIYFVDMLEQPIVYRSQPTTLGEVLARQVNAYSRNQEWLDTTLVDEIFSIRASSQVSVSLLEEVQGKTLAVMDAVALYETLKKICLSPGQLKIFPRGNTRVLESAGVKFGLTFTVTEHDWVFQPIMTLSALGDHSGELGATWYFHAFVQTLYRLIVDGGHLDVIAEDGQGGFSLSIETLRGVDYLGGD